MCPIRPLSPIPTEPVIAGLDEVGRGPLAGPLVACGVIIKVPPKKLLKLLPVEPRDSKLLTIKQRQILYQLLTQLPLLTHQLSVISVPDINTHGIAWANRQAFLHIISRLPADHYIIDGNLDFSSIITSGGEIHPERSRRTNNIAIEQLNNPIITSHINADETILEVQIASIIAKVHRDHLMHQLHEQHPHYHWHTNMGYGTRQHLAALALHGPTPHHRTLFATTALKNYRSKFYSHP